VTKATNKNILRASLEKDFAWGIALKVRAHCFKDDSKDKYESFCQ
jgi:hypothetical protein